MYHFLCCRKVICVVVYVIIKLQHQPRGRIKMLDSAFNRSYQTILLTEVTESIKITLTFFWRHKIDRPYSCQCYCNSTCLNCRAINNLSLFRFPLDHNIMQTRAMLVFLIFCLSGLVVGEVLNRGVPAYRFKRSFGYLPDNCRINGCSFENCAEWCRSYERTLNIQYQAMLAIAQNIGS